ncbi:MAG: non-canonical purine NTP pyrophosphatase [Oligoflexia bacterium]|nr:non-canonical purine NTP pyrophosphatase [Oligoflexia bacterium]
MKNFEFIFASSNKHKFFEFEALLKDSPIKLISTSQQEKSLEVLEDGDSYHQNALLKAQAYYNHFNTKVNNRNKTSIRSANKIAVMADDSGLNVLALPTELGIHSARFGEACFGDIEGDKKTNLTYNDRCKLLLEKLKNIPNDCDRKACFVCVLCFYFSEQEIFFFEGRLEGKIGHEIRGSGGFGFDPVFIPSLDLTESSSQSSLAEMDEWKQLHSHRAIAVNEAKKFFSSKST